MLTGARHEILLGKGAAGEMILQLRALVALVGDPRSIASTHMVAYSHS